MLIQTSEITIRNLKEGVRAADFNKYISEAEDEEIREFLGDPLYKALVDAAADSPFSSGIYYDLLYGSEYTSGTYTIDHPGLKKAIEYFAYARYLLNEGMVHTRNGAKIYESDNSVQPEYRLVKDRASEARSIGQTYLNRTEKFLYEKRTTYPLWKCDVERRSGGLKLRITGHD